ncbi:transcriptional regulator [Chitinimonas prasina]|uniref:Transcriptional regulator n=2 Tax=Chitinimonas prasina TaxID=1434937 RepID=A0ABQ5YEV8_9NEIS|nr:transcriptional regulator [Chitinimonas prasina]
MLAPLLIAFKEVARQGSVTAAARQLDCSQPTITARIRQLEERYAVELFHRRGSRLDLTDIGTHLLPLIDQLLQQEGDIDFLLRNAGALRGGSLRIGVTGPYYILPSVAAFRQQYPAVEVSIEVGNSQAVLEALDDYEIDLAVSSHEVEDSRLERRTIATDPLVLIVPQRHRLAALADICLADLADCNLLLREPGSMTRKLTEQALQGAGIKLASSMVIGSREAICEAVRLGMGCSLMPRGEVPTQAGLAICSLREPIPVLHEYLYTLSTRAHNPVIAAFLAALPPHRLP